MQKNKLTEDLFPTKEIKDEVVEIMRGKKKKLILNISLMVFYIVLLIATLFIF